MAHALAGPTQQLCRIRERRSVKKTNVDVRLENPDIGKRRVFDTCGRQVIMQNLANVRAEASHALKPHPRERAELGRVSIEPRFNIGSAYNCSAESKKSLCCPHRYRMTRRWSRVAALFVISVSRGGPTESDAYCAGPP